ncbi:hypothetical protein V8C86DRAFT_3022484 [Haematococcus lacustris]
MGSSKWDRLRLKAIEAASDIFPRVIKPVNCPRIDGVVATGSVAVEGGQSWLKAAESPNRGQCKRVLLEIHVWKRETHPNLASRRRKWPRSQHQRRARSHLRSQHRSPVSRQPAWKLGVQPSTKLARTQRSHASLPHRQLATLSSMRLRRRGTDERGCGVMLSQHAHILACASA